MEITNKPLTTETNTNLLLCEDDECCRQKRGEMHPFNPFSRPQNVGVWVSYLDRKFYDEQNLISRHY